MLSLSSVTCRLECRIRSSRNLPNRLALCSVGSGLNDQLFLQSAVDPSHLDASLNCHLGRVTVQIRACAVEEPKSRIASSVVQLLPISKMSVKFEKETVRDAPIPGGRRTDIAHEVGERLTGGKTQTGYLAVSPLVADLLDCADDVVYRHTSSSCSPTLFAPRCLPRVLWQRCKNFLRLTLPKISVNMATISALEFPKWLHTALS